MYDLQHWILRDLHRWYEFLVVSNASKLLHGFCADAINEPEPFEITMWCILFPCQVRLNVPIRSFWCVHQVWRFPVATVDVIHSTTESRYCFGRTALCELNTSHQTQRGQTDTNLIIRADLCSKTLYLKKKPSTNLSNDLHLFRKEQWPDPTWHSARKKPTKKEEKEEPALNVDAKQVGLRPKVVIWKMFDAQQESIREV